MSPFEQEKPSKEEIKLLEYKEKPIISSSQPPTPKMSEVVFGPAKVRQAATAPTAISTQTSEVQTEKIHQSLITSEVTKTINNIRIKHGSIHLGFGPFRSELKKVLEDLGIPSNMRQQYYVSGFDSYKKMLASRNDDFRGVGSGIMIL